MRGNRGDRGSESVEMALVLPIVLIVVAMLVVGGRIAVASDRMTGVAGAAAREASIARSAGAAQANAHEAAAAALSDASLRCTSLTVSVDTSAFGSTTPGATVQVSVSCTVPLSDIGIPGLPGSKTLHDSASSPLDPARSVS